MGLGQSNQGASSREGPTCTDSCRPMPGLKPTPEVASTSASDLNSSRLDDEPDFSSGAREGRQLQRYAENGERLVAGCIPVRTREDGGLEVCLITSRNGRGWVFPKGGWERDETIEMATKRETYEEAGVRGTLDETPVGVFTFRSDKKERLAQRDGGACIAHVRVMRVQEELIQWPENNERERKWVRPGDGLDLIRHKWMREAFTVWFNTLTPTEREGNKAEQA